MSRAHVLVLPFPAQGHVNPLMDLSHELAKHGIKITFVNTDFINKQIMEAEATRSEDKEQVGSDQIQMVSIPDGIEQEEDRNRWEILIESIWQVMPMKLEQMIQEISENAENERISCVVADAAMGWALEVAEKMGIHRATFLSTSAAVLALCFSIPKLLDDGIIDDDGTPTKDQIIHLAPKMPAMRTKHFPWAQMGAGLNAQKLVFNCMMRNNAAEIAEWAICNSAHELEPSAFAYAPNILPIGPLQASKSNHVDHLAGSFWREDSTCLNWLDQQPDKSVIYVAFGSFTIFDLLQLQELALGLELSNKPFLWVVRSDINNGAINSAHELEPSAFAYAPNILPIGPLQASKSNHVDHLAGSFWREDSTCLNWLDQQPDKSVIYVAFGSFTIFDLLQLQELALGLELSNKPFLWVVRSDINNGAVNAFLKEFEDRLCSHGKVVGWAPQQKVLRHPSIACFLSHCGWNSTIEGVINGVPFLSWPYFADQFLNETYICDIWKVGLRLNRDNGIISQEEITFKIKQVLNDECLRARASELKEKVIDNVKDGGSSNKNLKNLVDWIKA